MDRVVYAHQGDTVDLICQRAYGRTAGVTEQVLRRNPGLAAIGPTLPQGTRVVLPAAPQEGQRKKLIQLWD